MKQGNICLKAVLLMVWLLTIASCIGLRSELWIEADGSGKLDIEYRLPQVLIESFKKEGQSVEVVNSNGIEIPKVLSEENMRRELEALQGFTLDGYGVRKEGEDVYVRLVISFTGIQNMHSIDFIPPIEVESENGKIIFTQDTLINSGMDGNNPEIYKIYKDYKITFIIHAPRRITSHNIGQLSEDGRTVSVEYSLLASKQEQENKTLEENDKLQVEW